jgi:hypothetical protein
VLQIEEEMLIIYREYLAQLLIPETEVKRDPEGKQRLPILLIKFHLVIVKLQKQVADKLILHHYSVTFLAEPDAIQKCGVNGILTPVWQIRIAAHIPVRRIGSMPVILIGSAKLQETGKPFAYPEIREI